MGRRIAEFAGSVLPARATVSSGTVESDDGGSRPIGPQLTHAFGAGLTDAAWRPSEDDPEPSILLELSATTLVDAVVLRERITLGQRLERVSVHGILSGEESLLAETSAVGYQRILRFAPAAVDAVRVRITAARGRPALQSVAILEAIPTY